MWLEDLQAPVGPPSARRFANGGDAIAWAVAELERLRVVEGYRLGGAGCRCYDVHPWHLAGDRDAATAIGLRVNGIRRAWQPAGALGTLWLYAADSRSWASLQLLDEPPYPVRRAGPRALFDEVIEAYRWCDAGEPAFTQWLVTVTPERQTITLQR